MSPFSKYLSCTAACLLLICSASQAMAQPPGGEREKKFRQFKELKLLETLDLNEDAAREFLLRYSAHQKAISEAKRKLEESVAELREAVQNKAPEETLKRLNDAVNKCFNDMQNAVRNATLDVRSILGEEKYARFLIFEHRFLDEVKRTIRQRHR